MNTLTNTGLNAGITSDPQVINQANNLPDVPGVDDNTTTKSGVKNVGTQAQTENAENVENDKLNGSIIDRVKLLFPVPCLDAAPLKAKYQALGLGDDEINFIIAGLEKQYNTEHADEIKAAKNITPVEFWAKFSAAEIFAEFSDIENFSLATIFDAEKKVIKIYRSGQNENGTFSSYNITAQAWDNTDVKTPYYFSETDDINLDNLFRAVASTKYIVDAQEKNGRAVCRLGLPINRACTELKQYNDYAGKGIDRSRTAAAVVELCRRLGVTSQVRKLLEK